MASVPRGDKSIGALYSLSSKISQELHNLREDFTTRMDVLLNNHHVDGATPPKNPYKIRRVQFGNRMCPIVLQRNNGPCALPAIMNCLILSNEIILDPAIAEVSEAYLLTKISNMLLKKTDEDISAAWMLVPKITTGIELNPKFTGIYDFTKHSEDVIFKALVIPLVHGWMVDPLDAHTSLVVVGFKSFNDLVDDLTRFEDQVLANRGEESVRLAVFKDRATKIKNLLIGRTMTKYGMDQLRLNLQDCTLSTLYTSNNFRTICKFEGHIYALVTDNAMIETHPGLVWERLDDEKGNTTYCMWDFKEMADQETKHTRKFMYK